MKGKRKRLFLMFRHKNKIAWRHHIYCEEIQRMEEETIEWDEDRYSRLADVEADLDELMDYAEYPIVILPDHLYKLAKDTVRWIKEKEAVTDTEASKAFVAIRSLLPWIAVLSCIVTGCEKKNVHTENLEDQICRVLEEKYNIKDFVIDGLQFIPSSGPFGKGHYTANVKTAEGKEFNVLMYEGSNDLLDNYLSTVYGEELEERAVKILDSLDSIDHYTANLVYSCISLGQDIDSADQYLKMGQVCVDAEISLKADMADIAAQDCYEIGQYLREAGYYYTISYSAMDRRLYDVYSNLTDNLTLDQLKAKLGDQIDNLTWSEINEKLGE